MRSLFSRIEVAMQVKALSLHQPWATLIACGAKQIETRSWTTQHRGLVAIHATQQSPRAAMECALQEPCLGALRAAGFDTPEELPRGCVVALCRLVACTAISQPPPYPESAFGEYTPGRFAWYLDDIWSLPRPLPARGAQGLWSCELPEALIEARAAAVTRPQFGRAAGYPAYR
jgi:activating signal cointegrator 1